jgi:hypothetical protein
LLVSGSEGAARRSLYGADPGPMRWHYRYVINALVEQAIVD